MLLTSNTFQSIKKALLLMILIGFCQSTDLMAQSSIQELRSTSVNQSPINYHLPSFKVVASSDSSETKFMVYIENPAKAKMLIRIYHNFYGELFRKESKETIFNHRFDLSFAEDGDYWIEASIGKEKIRKQIRINTITQVSRKIAIN